MLFARNLHFIFVNRANYTIFAVKIDKKELENKSGITEEHQVSGGS